MSTLVTVGRHRLQRLLGQGGFGMVWLAYDDLLEAPVAVKVMAEKWVHRLDLRERFLDEARLLRQAQSDRVVQVHDIGELPDGRPYFVMTYADGGTLADRLQQGPMSVDQALRFAVQAARGVADLHAAGIVHRDIKPSNILLHTVSGGRERLLVADLGLAKSLAQASGLTQGVGSPGYMAPEQVPEDILVDVDERADVYGLGVLTYELLTGSLPGSTGQADWPGPPHPQVSAAVRRVTRRALEPERERRWDNATAFADALEAAHAMTFPRRLLRTVAPGGGTSRRRVGALLAGTAVIVTAGLATRGVFDADSAVDTKPRAGAGSTTTAEPHATTTASASQPKHRSAAVAGSSASPTRSAAPPSSSSTLAGAKATQTAGPSSKETDSDSDSGSGKVVSASPKWTTLTVRHDQQLMPGESWATNRTTMTMQTDGNLVIYDEDHHRRWSSGTSGTGYRAIMQADGNLVVYDKDTWGVWSSVTSGHDGAYLYLGTDGDVSVVYQGTTLWSAGTQH
ncbi:protein kinase domain-containing protein [Streptomyces gilvus]|uniref:protein kinase domain-containing protein n=1 Tax=Streptomyces gilvus TaxID=2920937 RepID=UPI001F109BD9|nr:protein kinase [Streptomyces sp. CME 23]MCH5674437.1 protein kinase [Streptomyces sp. CME 23]